MHSKQARINQLKKISHISVVISAMLLFIGIMCIYVVKIQDLSVIAWCIFGISFVFTCVVSIIRGYMEVRQKRQK